MSGNDANDTLDTTKLKAVRTDFDKLIMGERRDRKRGVNSDVAECVHDALERSSPDEHAGNKVYPSTDFCKDGISEKEREDKLDFDHENTGTAVLDGLAIRGILEDVRKSEKEAERGFSVREDNLGHWQGFWDTPEPIEVGQAVYSISPNDSFISIPIPPGQL